MASFGQSPFSQLYFAFGSNMHLQQMARRCPQSTLYARGKLCSYKWQINHRGVANIVESKPEDAVEGLLFFVSRSDVTSLDRNEGVAKGFYSKRYLSIEVEPLLVEPPLSAKSDISATVRWLEEYSRNKTQSSPLPALEPATSTHQDEAMVEESRRHVVNALVYVSGQTEEGCIRLEYVSRMKSAMFDAKELGASKTYLDNCLLPLVSARDVEIAPEEERAVAESSESRSSQYIAPAGHGGGQRDRATKRRDHKHALDGRDATRRGCHRGRRHRGEKRRDLREFSDPPIGPQDSQHQGEVQKQTPEHDMDFTGNEVGGVNPDSTEPFPTSHESHEVESSWTSSVGAFLGRVGFS
ncbi:hypothetical protein GGR53DRAFT_501527 [Hypoxylon sp. FL1150]|nr:hypothetical protein GGR53DRAFT_501527 [Hypoxylon sp. FL1150]